MSSSPAFIQHTGLPVSTPCDPLSRRRPRRRPAAAWNISASASNSNTVTVLDYGAGNVRSLTNAIAALGYTPKFVDSPHDILSAEKLLFPGVGTFAAAMHTLSRLGYVDPLREYLLADRPFFGICLGLQTLYSGSEENHGVEGLNILPGSIEKFPAPPPSSPYSVPHMGWNSVTQHAPSHLLDTHPPHAGSLANDRFYFVHSYRKPFSPHDTHVLATTTHAGAPFVSMVQRGNIYATQFHPEKSGAAGLHLLRNFLSAPPLGAPPAPPPAASHAAALHSTPPSLAKRIVACLDVRENDQGDLVVTKGDQYDVREKSAGRSVRNLGKPVALAHRYYNEGADEVVFLNITSFRTQPLADAPMLKVLEATSEGVFVPLCIGGGIRGYTDPASGTEYSALDVAARYFRAGADKVSIGSDAVAAAEEYYAAGRKPSGASSIETIAAVYGAQAVVVSVDPRRVWVAGPEDAGGHKVVRPRGGVRGPGGEEWCWYQCTVKGGREGRDLDVAELVTAVEALGAGEILVNSMDADGTNKGYDLDLISMVRTAISIPVIASSGAGKVEHFTECFDGTDVEAALAAGIFHRKEVGIDQVKAHMQAHGTPVRASSTAATVGAASVE